MAGDDKTLVDRWLYRLKNNPFIATLVLFGIVVGAVMTVVGSVQNVFSPPASPVEARNPSAVSGAGTMSANTESTTKKGDVNEASGHEETGKEMVRIAALAMADDLCFEFLVDERDKADTPWQGLPDSGWTMTQEGWRQSEGRCIAEWLPAELERMMSDGNPGDARQHLSELRDRILTEAEASTVLSIEKRIQRGELGNDVRAVLQEVRSRVHPHFQVVLLNEGTKPAILVGVEARLLAESPNEGSGGETPYGIVIPSAQKIVIPFYLYPDGTSEEELAQMLGTKGRLAVPIVRSVTCEPTSIPAGGLTRLEVALQLEAPSGRYYFDLGFSLGSGLTLRSQEFFLDVGD